MSFQEGDLLICIDNTVTNSLWKGIKPVIGDYYTWRGDDIRPEFRRGFGYVEEIISPIANDGHEFLQAKRWYRKMDVDVNIEELVEESINVLST